MEQYSLLMNLLKTNLECHNAYLMHLMVRMILNSIIEPSHNGPAS